MADNRDIKWWTDYFGPYSSTKLKRALLQYEEEIKQQKLAVEAITNILKLRNENANSNDTTGTV